MESRRLMPFLGRRLLEQCLRLARFSPATTWTDLMSLCLQVKNKSATSQQQVNKKSTRSQQEVNKKSARSQQQVSKKSTRSQPQFNNKSTRTQLQLNNKSTTAHWPGSPSLWRRKEWVGPESVCRHEPENRKKLFKRKTNKKWQVALVKLDPWCELTWRQVVQRSASWYSFYTGWYFVVLGQ